MSERPPFITVIIPVYNGRDFLGRCLDGVLSSTYRDFEIVTVDDCSSDGSGDVARTHGARVMTTPVRSGPGAARNLAGGTAKGEVLMFIDADVVVQPDTVGQIAERFKSDLGLSAVFGSYDDKPDASNFLSQYKNLQHHFVHQNSSQEASTFWSGLGAMRREVFLSHGGFDVNKFEVPSIEDIDLGSRLRRAGHRILLDRTIQATHLKKWTVMSHLHTEIMCRAIPWSRLIIENHEMINDMNLKLSDRLSAVLVGLSLLLLPIAVWKPAAVLILIGVLAVLLFLNREIMEFYIRKKGLLFALMTLPWQYLYFTYSGMAFVFCWFRHKCRQIFGSGSGRSLPQDDVT